MPHRTILEHNERDISERQRQQEAMEVSEVRYRRLFEAAKDGILILDASTSKITDSNPFISELLGYSREELYGKELADIGLFNDETTAHEAMERLQQDSYIRYDNLPLETKSKQRRDVEFVSNIYVENGTRVIQCNIRDITERKRAQEEQMRLAAIVSSSDDVIYAKDLDGIIITWNQAGERLYGYSAEEIVGKPFSKFVPETHVAQYQRVMDLLRNGEVIDPFETTSKCKDGSLVEVNTRISPLKDDQGRVVGGSVITRDISEQRAQEARIARTQARWERLVESNVIGVLIAHADGRIIDANDAILQMLEYTREDLEAGSLRWDTLTPPEYLYLDRDALTQIRESGRCKPFQKEYIRKDGTRLPLLIGAASLDEQEIVAWIVDLTRIKEHEQAILALNDRLRRAMTETHHRIKNNLQIITAMVDMQAMENPDTVPTSAVKRLGTQVAALASVHALLTEESKKDAAAKSLNARKVLAKLIPLVSECTTKQVIFEGAEARISARQAASLSLIANEIITNAIKHAHTQVNVKFEVTGTDAYLTVDDDGPGFPSGFAPETMSNNGLEIVCHLVRWDLSGSITFETGAGGGGRVSVKIPQFSHALVEEAASAFTAF